MHNIITLSSYNFRPKRFTLKSFKAACFVCHDLTLTAYKSAEAASRGASPNSDGVFFQFNLKGCEVTPDINLAQGKFQFKLEIPSAEGMTEMWLRCNGVSLNTLIIFEKDIVAQKTLLTMINDPT